MHRLEDAASRAPWRPCGSEVWLQWLVRHMEISPSHTHCLTGGLSSLNSAKHHIKLVCHRSTSPTGPPRDFALPSTLSFLPKVKVKMAGRQAGTGTWRTEIFGVEWNTVSRKILIAHIYIARRLCVSQHLCEHLWDTQVNHNILSTSHLHLYLQQL